MDLKAREPGLRTIGKPKELLLFMKPDLHSTTIVRTQVRTKEWQDWNVVYCRVYYSGYGLEKATGRPQGSESRKRWIRQHLNYWPCSFRALDTAA